MHISVEVPFGVQEDGSKYLTAEQLINDPELMAFYERFKNCFKPGPFNMDIVIYDNPKERIWSAIQEVSR